MVACLYLLPSTPIAAPGNSPNLCLKDQPTETALIERVSDGDTVVLTDKRRVRVIGLNTLELNSAAENDKLWAQRAKARLEELTTDGTVTLMLGNDEFDRYGRTLAHIVLPDNTLVAEILISEGLAFAVTVGANNRCTFSLHESEQRARDANLGVWKSPGEWLSDETTMSPPDRGFRLIRSSVVSITKKGSATVLTLRNGLNVKLDKHWGKNDTSTVTSELLGQHVELRGWVGTNAGQTTVTLSHPANLQKITH